MVDGFAKTPRYVLKDGAVPISPDIAHASSDVSYTVVFGFSDKPEYDRFLKVNSSALTPYPLVKGFLQHPVAPDRDLLQLVVIDAASAQQPVLHAATFKAVAQALQHGLDSVEVSHRLVVDETSSQYWVQSSVDSAAERSVT